jgi:hypothetical protein
MDIVSIQRKPFKKTTFSAKNTSANDFFREKNCVKRTTAKVHFAYSLTLHRRPQRKKSFQSIFFRYLLFAEKPFAGLPPSQIMI